MGRVSADFGVMLPFFLTKVLGRSREILNIWWLILRYSRSGTTWEGCLLFRSVDVFRTFAWRGRKCETFGGSLGIRIAVGSNLELKCECPLQNPHVFLRVFRPNKPIKLTTWVDWWAGGVENLSEDRTPSW